MCAALFAVDHYCGRSTAALVKNLVRAVLWGKLWLYFLPHLVAVSTFQTGIHADVCIAALGGKLFASMLAGLVFLHRKIGTSASGLRLEEVEIAEL